MALEIKYFQAFLASKENPDVYNDQIENICKDQNPHKNSDDAPELLHDYKSFIKKTKAGDHGQTANEANSSEIKQKNKSFSRSPIDLTLEQTINTDVACQRRGIIALTNSISAQQRWAQSHTSRTSIISHLLESVGISKKEDTSDDLKRSKKNSKDFQQIITAIEGTMVLFSADLDKNELFNISSG